MTEKIHPILDHPHEYEIVHFIFHKNIDEPINSYIDLHLKKNNNITKLRFFQPVELEVQKGFSGQYSGMEILDVSDRQMENINIFVRNFEHEPGITFWARKVVKLNE